MKTIEEKAKAYDEAIGKAAVLYKASEPMSGCNVIIETLFPELKESGDEKIRKAIIEGLREMKSSFHTISSIKIDDAIAWLEKQEGCEYIKKDWLEHIKQSWYKEGFIDGKYSDGTSKEWTINDAATLKELIDFLENGTAKLQHDLTRYANWLKNQFTPIEKQGEQKHIDKIEPKFKIGDWIINPKTGNVLQIKNVLLCGNKGNYEFDYSSMPIESVDKHYHLWTIQDAKDGDMLACKDELILFKSYDNKNLCYYCWYNGQTNNFFPKDTHTSRPRLDIIVPATKEQRDLLFRKMNEEGYEWDVKNQVMTKIEQKSINSYCQENCKGFQETGKCFADGECKAKREAEQELTDLNEFINELSKQFPDISFAKLSRIVVRVAKWAKSNQPKQEWSEEDEINVYNIIHFLEEPSTLENNEPCKKIVIAWLKSLRPHNLWKPSDEQIAQLQIVIDTYYNEGIYDPILTELLFQLKKLKES